METFKPKRRDLIRIAALGSAGAFTAESAISSAKELGGTAMRDMKIALLQIYANQKDINFIFCEVMQ